jgi:acyl-CoA synthetase (NDP forming)
MSWSAGKGRVPGLRRKSGADAVKLDLSGAGDVRRADEELAGKFAERLTGVLLQPMVTGGTEVIIGVVREPPPRRPGRRPDRAQRYRAARVPAGP